jgi:transposase
VVALRYDVSGSWVRRVKQERRELGKTARCTTRRRVPAWAVHREAIEQLTAERPDLTLAELKQALGTELSRQTRCTALQKLKLTLKKVLRATEQDRPDVDARRAVWRVQQTGLDPERLVFLDETWAKTNMTRPLAPRHAADRVCSLRALEDHDVCGGASHEWPDRAAGDRWPDQWRSVSGVRPTTIGAHAQTR